jgi:hypothetical protein
MYLDSIDKVRAVEWSKSYLWDICFFGGNGYGPPPYPFDSWFPATEVQDLVCSVNTNEFSSPMRQFSVPVNSNLRRLKIDFIDDMYCTLENYFVEWMDVQILNNGKGVTPVEECLRSLLVYRLDASRKPVKGYLYSVFPAGELPFNGRSDSQANEYALDFLVWNSKRVL